MSTCNLHTLPFCLQLLDRKYKLCLVKAWIILPFCANIALQYTLLSRSKLLSDPVSFQYFGPYKLQS